MRKGTKALVVAGSICLPAAGFVAMALLWKPGDGYAFLGRERPLVITVDGETGGGGGGYDVHVYSWKEDFTVVHAKAAKELAGLGFTEDPPKAASGNIDPISSRLTFWSKGRAEYISLAVGRAASYREAMNLPGSAIRDPGWVTVAVYRHLEDGPYVWIRRALPHQEG